MVVARRLWEPRKLLLRNDGDSARSTVRELTAFAAWTIKYQCAYVGGRLRIPRIFWQAVLRSPVLGVAPEVDGCDPCLGASASVFFE